MFEPPKKVTKPRPRRRAAARAIALLMLLAGGAVGALRGRAQSPSLGNYIRQTPAATAELALSNAWTAVFDLLLPDGAETALFQNTHDVILIGLQESRLGLVTASGERQPIELGAGDVRWLPRHRFKSLVNRGGEQSRAVAVEIKSGASGASCECAGAVERVVCGCERGRLPGLWALSTGTVTLAGTTLTSERPLWGPGTRNNTLLVAITPLRLEQAPTAMIELRSGEAYWLPQGTHRLKDAGRRPARFVTVEF